MNGIELPERLEGMLTTDVPFALIDEVEVPNIVAKNKGTVLVI